MHERHWEVLDQELRNNEQGPIRRAYVKPPVRKALLDAVLQLVPNIGNKSRRDGHLPVVWPDTVTRGLLRRSAPLVVIIHHLDHPVAKDLVFAHQSDEVCVDVEVGCSRRLKGHADRQEEGAHYAVQKEKHIAAAILIAFGANAQIMNKKGQFAWALAPDHRKNKVLDVLLSDDLVDDASVDGLVVPIVTTQYVFN